MTAQINCTDSLIVETEHSVSIAQMFSPSSVRLLIKAVFTVINDVQAVIGQDDLHAPILFHALFKVLAVILAWI